MTESRTTYPPRCHLPTDTAVAKISQQLGRDVCQGADVTVPLLHAASRAISRELTRFRWLGRDLVGESDSLADARGGSGGFDRTPPRSLPPTRFRTRSDAHGATRFGGRAHRPIRTRRARLKPHGGLGAAALEYGMLLVLDNYDSFTYNLVQYAGELGADPVVYRNDALTPAEASP